MYACVYVCMYVCMYRNNGEDGQALAESVSFKVYVCNYVCLLCMYVCKCVYYV